jgi:putative ABC transport system permease protein
MSLLDAIRYRVRAVLDREGLEAERAEEFRFHQSLEQQQRKHDGLSTDEARIASHRVFGSEVYYQEEVRQMSFAARLESFSRNARLGVRSLARAPEFTIATVLTLGLGIGGLTAVAALVKSVMLTPLPFPDADRLVGVWVNYPKIGVEANDHSDATYHLFREYARSTAAVGAFDVDQVNLSEGDSPERVTAVRATAGFFQVLGATPVLGRFYSGEEDRPGGAAVVVLSEGLWRRRYGSDPAVIGRVVTLDGQATEVIGVMPAALVYPNPQVQLWVPMRFDPASVLPASTSHSIIARLRDGVTHEATQADLQQAQNRLPDVYPDAGFGFNTRQYMEVADPRVIVHSLRDDVVGDIGDVLWVLAGTAAFVLLVACANVATLFLMRAESRQREAAVAMALGSRHGLSARFMIEGLLLGAAGAVLGFAVASGAIGALVRTSSADIPRLGEVGLDAPLVIGIAGLALLLGLACSLLPVNRLRTLQVSIVLRSGGRAATGSRDRQRARQALVVAQVALAFALLAGSGLLARTWLELRAVQPGFDAGSVLTFRVALPSATYPELPEITRFFERARDRLAALPGVEDVSLTTNVPLGTSPPGNNTFFLQDKPDGDLAKMNASISFVASDYFRALRIPILAGRSFDRLDPDRLSDEVVVSAALAKAQYGDDPNAAIGRQIRLAPTVPWTTIVGVVGDVRVLSLERPPRETIYLPPNTSWFSMGSAGPAEAKLARMLLPRAMSIVIRTSGRPSDLAPSARAAMRELDPSLPLYEFAPMAEVVDASMARTTFTAWMLAAAAAIALLLGVIGVYGVIAYTVGMRTREIGLRLALGARPGLVRMMIVNQGVRLVAAGIIAGLALTFMLTRSLQALLYGVSHNDPATLLLVTAMLGGAALFAAWIPATRAGRVDPAVTLGGD